MHSGKGFTLSAYQVHTEGLLTCTAIRDYRESIRNFLCSQGVVSRLFPTNAQSIIIGTTKILFLFVTVCVNCPTKEIYFEKLDNFPRAPFTFLQVPAPALNLWLCLVLTLVFWYSWADFSHTRPEFCLAPRSTPIPFFSSCLSNQGGNCRQTPLWLQHRELGMLRRRSRLWLHWQFSAPDLPLSPFPHSNKRYWNVYQKDTRPLFFFKNDPILISFRRVFQSCETPQAWGRPHYFSAPRTAPRCH